MMKFKTVQDLANNITQETVLELTNGTILTVSSCSLIKENYNFLAFSSFNNKKSEYNLMNLWAKGELAKYVEGCENTAPVKKEITIQYNN